MYKSYKSFVYLFCVLLLSFSPLWSAASGELILKNASHADQLIGPSAKDGISQGHDLKIVVQKVKHGKKMANDARIGIIIRHGNSDYATLSAQLNDTGYAEVLYTIPRDWLGIYQINVVSFEGEQQHWSSSSPFRVIPAEPGSDVPEATPIALLLAAIIALCLCWRPLVQRD